MLPTYPQRIRTVAFSYMAVFSSLSESEGFSKVACPAGRFLRFLSLSHILLLGFVSAALMTPVQAQQYQQMLPLDEDRNRDLGIESVKDVVLAENGFSYIADERAGKVHILGPEGLYIQSFAYFEGPAGAHSLRRPVALAAGPDNHLYIADDRSGQVHVLKSHEYLITIGESGKDPGQFREIMDIAVDYDNYLYVADSKSDRINIFDDEGQFINWIAGIGGIEARAFENLRGIGINGQNELYVLESDPGRVHIFSDSGHHIRSIERLGTSGMRIENTRSLAVFENGHFAVLDGDSGSLSLFDENGVFIQRTGRSGSSSSPGIYRDPVQLSVSPVNPHQLFVVDARAGIVQQYEYVYAGQDYIRREKITVASNEDEIPAFQDAVFAPNGNLYYIPADDTDRVIGMNPETGEQLFRLPARQAARLATDAENNVYVLDDHRRTNEVNIFDANGVLKLTLGQEISNPLRNPAAIAVKSDGTIMVLDQRHDFIHQWTAEGQYLGSTISLRSFDSSSISFMRVDSNDNIYLLDNSVNSIHRLNAAGQPVSPNALKVSGHDPSDAAAEILWFDIDNLDQIHLFNNETHQYSLMKWEVSDRAVQDPELLFCFGREGEEQLSFEKVERIALNPQLLHAYVMNDKGKEQRSAAITIRPPKPELQRFLFSASDGHLELKPISDEQNISSSYALAIENRLSNQLEIISSDMQTVRVENSEQKDELIYYRLLRSSMGNYSDPSEPFADYVGLGRYYAGQEAYMQAFDQYSNALQSYSSTDESLSAFIAADYLEWARTLTNRGEAYPTVILLRSASELLNEQDPLNRSIGEVLNTLYSTLSRRGEFDELLSNMEPLTEIQNDIIADEVSRELAGIAAAMVNTGLEERMLQAISIYDELLDWSDYNKGILYSGKARAELAHYRLLEEQNAPYITTSLKLNRARAAVTDALEQIQLVNDLYNETRIIEMETLMESRGYEEIISISEAELSGQIPGLQQDFVETYRILGGEAMMAAGEHNRAIYNFMELLQTKPENPEYQHYVARAHYHAENFNEAANIYKQLSINDPENPQWIAGIGRVEFMMGNYAEAIFQLEQAARMMTNTGTAATDSDGLFGTLARAYYADGKYNNALEHYQNSIEKTEEQIALLRERQVQQVRLQPHQDKLETYLFEYGRANMRLRNTEAARQTFEKLTTLTSNNPAYFFELGNAYANLGLFYLAEQAHFRATSLDPSSEQYSNAYAEAEAQSNEYAANQPAVQILNMDVKPIFPSLYKNYAESQSIGQAIIENNTRSAVHNARIEISLNRYSSQTMTIELPMLPPRSTSHIPLYLQIESSILENTEDLRAELSAELQYAVSGESFTNSASTSVAVYRRSAISWADKQSLAAFIHPSNDNIRALTSRIATSLQPQIYTELPNHIVSAAQTYTTLNNNGFVYQRDPNIPSLLADGALDSIQYPLETLISRTGECDDFVVMYATLLEAQGIRTAYIDVPGHIFMAFDTGLEPDQLQYMNLDESLFILHDNTVWLPIETTVLGRGNFLEAWTNAAQRWYDEKEQGSRPQLVSIDYAHQLYESADLKTEDYDPQIEFTETVAEGFTKTLQDITATFNGGMIQNLMTRLSSDRENLYLINRLGVLQAQSLEYEEALETLKKGLEIYPESPQINNNIANIYFRNQDYSRAAEHYQKSINHAPEKAELYVNLARSFLRNEQMQQAEEAFRAAVGIDASVQDRYDFIGEELSF